MPVPRISENQRYRKTSATGFESSPVIVSDVNPIIDAVNDLVANSNQTLSEVLANGGTATSLALKGVMSDETGSGALVFGTSPSLTTPSLTNAAGTFTFLNSVTWSAPASPVQIAFTSGSTITFQGTDTYIGRATTDTITNKRVVPRITSGTATGFSGDLKSSWDIIEIVLAAGNITITDTAASVANGEMLSFRIKDNGVPRTITYTNGNYRGLQDALPAITIAGKWMYMDFRWNATDAKWDLINLVNEA